MDSIRKILSEEYQVARTINHYWDNALELCKKGEFRESENVCSNVLTQRPDLKKFQKLKAICQERICSIANPPANQANKSLVCLNVKPDQPMAIYFDEPPNFQICTFDYTGSGYQPELPYPIDYHFSLKTEGKGHIMSVLAEKLPNDFAFYGFFDDDIFITVRDINRMLFTANLLQLDLFQASLSVNSYVNLSHLSNKSGYHLKETSVVEIMMPFLSNYGYNKTKDKFSESISGWGLDYLISSILFREKRKMAIIHDVVASHLKATSSRNWMCSNGKTSLEELGHVVKKYKLLDYPIF